MTAPTHLPRPGQTASAFPAHDPSTYFELAQQAFQTALANAGAHSEDYVIGGHRLRLVFAGQAWRPHFTAALAHRAAPPAEKVDLTIWVWDDAATGAQMPSPPWSAEDYTLRGEIPAACNERYRAGYQVDAGLLNLLDLRQGLGLMWTADAARLPRYELTLPVRTLLHWWVGARGQQMAHAGAVGNASGGVLLVGKGGSGKSTTALACLEAGLDYAGDDYVIFDDQPAPRAHSVYCSGKLNADHIGRLPAYVPQIHNQAQLGSEKALLYLNARYAGRLAADLPLSAIVLPRVTGAAHSRYRPVATVPALAALAASTLRQLPCAGQADHERMRRLALRVPAYALDLGSDLENIPAVVTRLIAEAAG